MQVEVEVPNHEAKLFAGMYAEVKFSLPEENAPIVIPANTLMFRSVGPQVATVTDQNRRFAGGNHRAGEAAGEAESEWFGVQWSELILHFVRSAPPRNLRQQ